MKPLLRKIVGHFVAEFVFDHWILAEGLEGLWIVDVFATLGFPYPLTGWPRIGIHCWLRIDFAVEIHICKENVLLGLYQQPDPGRGFLMLYSVSFTSNFHNLKHK